MYDQKTKKTINYEELNATTMTIIITLNGYVNPKFSYYLLPVTKVIYNHKKKSSRFKLPNAPAGSIISIRYDKFVRGIIRNDKKSFKHSASIDIWTNKKSVGIKLYKNKMHLCGVVSEENALEAVNYLLTYLKNIQKILNKIQNDPDHSSEILAWYKDNLRGCQDLIPAFERKKVGIYCLNIFKPLLDYSIVPPKNKPPSHFDLDILNFYMSLSGDFVHYKSFCKKLDCISSMTSICDENIDIKLISRAMVNYNYNIGFAIDRNLFDSYMQKYPSFISRFDNVLQDHVTVEMPYSPPLEKSNIKRKNNKTPHHTYLVYKSGSITQSGPGGKLMGEAFNKFIQTVNQIRPFVEYIKS